VLRGEIGALIIEKFIDVQQAKNTALSFENVSANGALSSESIAEYLERAARFSSAIEEICSPHGESPMTKVQRLLGAVLRARRLELQGREMFAGLVRVVRKGGEILPHQDELGEDMPDLDFAKRLTLPGGQLAVNMYLQVPAEGGELQLWRDKYTAAQIANLRMPSSDYGINPALLPQPDAVIKPRIGDLIFFDTSRMHAVTKANGIARVSISFFLGIGSDGEARYWS